jgi:hypothetical protein
MQTVIQRNKHHFLKKKQKIFSGRGLRITQFPRASFVHGMSIAAWLLTHRGTGSKQKA